MRTSTKKMTRDEYQYWLSSRTPNQLRKECLSQFDRSNKLEGDLAETICEKEALEASGAEMTKEFSRMKKDLEAATAENEKLKRLAKHLSDRVSQLNSIKFDRTSEQDVLDVIMEPDDNELDDIVAYIPVTMADGSVVLVPKKKAKTATGQKTTGTGKGHGGRPKGSKNKVNLDGLDTVVTYEYDFDQMDEKYGEGNYRIYSYRSSKRLVKVRSYLYIKEIRTPVYSVGVEHSLTCPVSLTNPLLPKSYLDSSFVADLFNQHDVLCVPFNRQAEENARMGYPVSRGQLASWRILFATGPFKFVYELIKEYAFAHYMYHYNDETRWMVVMDGKKPGHMSWIWVDVSGIEQGEHECVLYTYEPTRSTDHLRTYYKDYSLEKLAIICDGYVSYPCFAKEDQDRVIICRDWMHVRRKFITALNLLKGTKASQEVLSKTPEYKMVSLCDSLFVQYDPLRKLAPDDRAPIAKKTITPIVEKIFRFADFLQEHGIAPKEEKLSEEEEIEHLPADLNSTDDPILKKAQKQAGSQENATDVKIGQFREFDFEGEKVRISYPASDALRIALGYISGENTRKSLSYFLEDGHILPDSGPAERSFKPVACDRKNSLFSYVQKGAEATCISHSLAESCRGNGAVPYEFFKYICDVLVPLGTWVTRTEIITLPDNTTKERKWLEWQPGPECKRRKAEFLPWAPEFFAHVEMEKQTVHGWCEVLSQKQPVIPKKAVNA